MMKNVNGIQEKAFLKIHLKGGKAEPRMSGLLFDHDYQLLVKKSHPGLKINITETGLPYYLAPLPYFEVFKPGIFKSIYTKAALNMPHLFHPSALVLGLPFEPYEQTAVLKKLPPLSRLKELACCHGATVVIIANVDPLVTKELGLHRQFLTLCSLPNMVLETLKFHSSRYNHVKRARRLFWKKGYQLVKNPSGSFACEFYAAYERTHRNAKVPWLKYEQQYFQEVGSLNTAHQIVAIDEDKAFLGAITAFHHHEQAHLARLAVDERYHRKDGIYFMLLYEAMHDAWSFGAKEIHLGPTAYELKNNLGAKPKTLINLVLPITWQKKLFAPSANFLLNQVLFRHLRQFENLKRYF